MPTLYTESRKSGNISGGWQYLNRGECPICSGARKDCRQNTESQLVHCRDIEANPANYVFRGTDKNGFGMWAHQASADEWNEEKRQEWRAKRERETREKKERHARSLSPAERDREIRNILGQLTLSASDRAILNKRAYLSETRIENFRSIIQWQPLSIPVSPELAGTSYRGDRLNNPVDGILVPIPNEDGLFVGLRLYNPNHKTNGHGKYTWLSSSGRGVHPQLQSGEYPIAVYWPRELRQTDRVGLCEGLEIKPAIAADRLGIPVIGFSGANFTLSPKSLKRAIETVRIKLASDRITCELLPDAGAVVNANIFPSQLRTIEILKSWGIPAKVAYWDQGFDKAIGDIDEIESTDPIRYLSYAEYEALDPNTEATRLSRRKSFIEELGALGSLASSAVKRILKRAKRKPYTPKPVNNDRTIEIGIGEYNKIPLRADYKGEKIILLTKGLSNEQRSRHRANFYEYAARLGWRVILDTSHTGSGKSFVMGELNPYHFYLETEGSPEVKRSLIYTCPSPRNPTVAAIERNFIELPTRHAGFVTDDSKLTPLGNPLRYRPQSDDIDPSMLVGENNCILYKQFLKLRSHGQSTTGLCSTCPMFEQCQKGTGQGYGFLFEMFTSLSKAKYLRAHPLGLSADVVDGKVCVHDEFTVSMPPTISIPITKDELMFELMAAIAFDPIVAPVAAAVLKLATLIDPDPAHKRYGYDTREAIAIMGELPENIHTIIATVRNWEEQENQKLLVPDDIGNYPESRPRWLSTLLSIWESGQREKLAGAISIQGKISISVKNNHPRDLYEAAHCSIYQDATTQPYRLAMLLGIETTDILWGAEEDPYIGNLEIQPINMGAYCGNDRSDDLTRRIDAVRDSEEFCRTVAIEYKKFARSGDLIHGSDGRGSNAFEKEKELVIVGLYRKNMGAVRDEFICLTGRNISIADNDPNFIRYYEDGNTAELLQEVGRLRGNRRPEERLKISVLDCDPLDGLKNYGYNVKPMIESAAICKDAAKPVQSIFLSTADAIAYSLIAGDTLESVIEKARGVTQAHVAELTGRSLSRIKQLSREVNMGWNRLLEGIGSLIYSLKAKLSPEETLSDCEFSPSEIAWFISEMIPIMSTEYAGREDEAWEEIKGLLDGGILSVAELPAYQMATILACILRKIVNADEIPALIRLLAPEQEFA